MFKKRDCEPESPKKCKSNTSTTSISSSLFTSPGAAAVVQEQVCEEDPLPADYQDKEYFKLGSKDPVNEERAKCLTDCDVAPVLLKLKQCEMRVTRKSRYTAETCHEETVYLMEALDQCVRAKAFNRLK